MSAPAIQGELGLALMDGSGNGVPAEEAVGAAVGGELAGVTLALGTQAPSTMAITVRAAA